MNDIPLTEIQRKAVDYVLPYVGHRWRADGKDIAQMRADWMDGDDPVPQSWTLPKIEYGDLILSDFQEVNDSLYNYVLGYAKVCIHQHGFTDYRKRKIRKECKDLADNIATAMMLGIL